MDATHGQARKGKTHRSGHRQTVAQIGFGLRFAERGQVEARGDALGQLAQVFASEHVAQFGLTEQNDLQQLLRGSFQIGQQAHLFQRLE